MSNVSSTPPNDAAATASSAVAATPQALFEITDRIEAQEDFAAAVDSLKAGHAATFDGVWGSSCAVVAAALARHAPSVLIVVCARLDEVESLIGDLSLFSALSPDRFPVHEALDVQEMVHDEAFGERVRLLKRLKTAEPPKILVTSIPALLQPVPTQAWLEERTRSVHVGQQISVDEVAKWLVQAGFQNTTAVEMPGEFSLRGGIVDVFAPDWYHPVRIEFFGDEIDSIRQFEVATQRSLMKLATVAITAATTMAFRAQDDVNSDLPFDADATPDRSDYRAADYRTAVHGPSSRNGAPKVDDGASRGAHLADYLPSKSWFLLIEPDDMLHEGRQYLERLESPSGYHRVDDVMRRIVEFPSITASAVAAGSLETICRLPIESVERFSGDVNKVRDELEEASSGQRVYLVCQTDAEVRRLSEVFAATRVAREGRLHYPIGSLQNGFRLVPDRIVLLSSGELFRRADIKRPAATRRRLGRAIDSFLELHEGDLVVHVSHGIARYRGMQLLEKNGRVEEHLELEFAGKTKLFVPAAKIGLVQKYVGGNKGKPMLARIGGKMWEKQKDRVRAAVTDMAGDMLDLQAARASRPGISFNVGTEWQHEFDASFPYKETPDQLTALEAITQDMKQPRPMDRLLCGDVGYGKTEVAMRAAFKAIDSGYQVAVLVPTTVLAEQHHRTFTARMAEFPFSIGSLSRFSTRKQQTETIARAASGELDVLIGTHRLVQHDVKFHNLGLVVIDEEQRFGVEVKERLKAIRQMVDVLTMTATPIPRTLHLGLMGIRDISNLETPPEDRLPVETRVTRFQPELVRQAVIRELNRNGQIFFVHNRVKDIHVVEKRLSQIVPEARIKVCHGQMNEHEMEKVMLDFVAHRFDLLLATTIVESGLDIPNANTIFINEADRYGLADLHQLRGRVGRYIHRAYCYMLIDPNKSLTPLSARRMKAIEEFSAMGAGFAIAMRDLEIRGAGNILGTQQSGFIAAVGYELYCTLLEQAVSTLKKQPPMDSPEVDIDLPGEGHIPRSYVPDIRLKIDLYRRLGRVSKPEELADFRSELVDRFGAPPEPVEYLLSLAELRVAAHRWSIYAVHIERPYAVLRFRSARRIQELAALSAGRLRIVDHQSAYLPLRESVADEQSVQKEIKSLLLKK